MAEPVPTPGAGLSLRRVPTGHLVAHLLGAVVGMVLIHGLVAAILDPTGAEAYALVAPAAGWPGAAEPAIAALAALGRSVGEGRLGWRIPVVLLWAGVPLLLALAAGRLGGRPAAVRAAWLCSAMPLAHAWGLFLGPAVVLAVAYGAASVGLAGLSTVTDGSRRSWPWMIVLLAAALLAVLATPAGWIVGMAAAAGLLVVRPITGRVLGADGALAGALSIVTLAGALLLVCGCPPSLASGPLAEILPPINVPVLGIVLAIGANPWVVAAMAGQAFGLRGGPPIGPGQGAEKILVVFGLVGLVLFLLTALAGADPLLASTAFVPLVVALATWRRLPEWTGVLGVTGAVLGSVLLFVLAAGIPVLPAADDPTARLRGWDEGGAAVAVWCGTVDGEDGPRVLAEAPIAARMALLVPDCAPVGLLGADGVPHPAAAAGERLVLVVHHDGEVPALPPGCVAGPHGAPAGPDGLDLVVRPSRCRAP